MENSTDSVLTIKTNAPVGFMKQALKEINISLENGYESGEGVIPRFMSDPYHYSFTYEE